MNKKIKLCIQGEPDKSYRKCPVTHGIPFADGEYKVGDKISLINAEGNMVPLQSRPLAYWDKDLQYVKWLLLDFQVESFNQQDNAEWLLQYGDASPEVDFSDKIEISREGNILIIDTGAMQMHLLDPPRHLDHLTEKNIFQKCIIKKSNSDTENVFDSSNAPFFFMKDQYGELFRTCGRGPRPLVTLEEQGALRTVVRINGNYCSEHGHKFCPYIIRIHFFAGKSAVKIHHSFIFDQEPHSVELSSIAMNLPFILTRKAAVTFAIDDTIHETLENDVSILQSTDRTCDVVNTGQAEYQGEKCDSWIAVHSKECSIVGIMPNFWQEYPKGFSFDNSGLNLWIYPKNCNTPLKFTSPFEGSALNLKNQDGTPMRDIKKITELIDSNPRAPIALKSLQVEDEESLLLAEKIAEKYCDERAITYNDLGHSNGAGAALSTEIWLDFNSSANQKDINALVTTAKYPLLASPLPSYSCETKAFGAFAPAGYLEFAEADAGLDFLFNEFISEPEIKCRLYGMGRYGNMVCSHAPGPGLAYLYYRDTEPEKALRFVGPYNNEANDQIMAVWGNFLHTGKREHFFTALRYARIIAETAIIHDHPTYPGRNGYMHYHNCHAWSGGWAPSHTLHSGTMIAYYLTGDERLLEVAKETADTIIKDLTPSGVLRCPTNYHLHREFTGPLWTLLEVYRATREEKYGDAARCSLNWFLRALPRPGSYPVSIFTCGERGDEAVVEPDGGAVGHARDIYNIFALGLELFDSKLMREHIIAEADRYVYEEAVDNFFTAEAAEKLLSPASKLWEIDDNFFWTQWIALPYFNTAMLCLAYQITENPVYCAYALDQVNGTFLRQVKRCKNRADWRFTWIQFAGYIPRLMWLAKEGMKNPEQLEVADLEWRTRREANGLAVYSGDGIDFTSDTMDCNGNIVNRSAVELPRNSPIRRRSPLTNLGKISTEDLDNEGKAHE